MVDRVSQFLIGIGGDDADISALLASLKGKFKSTVADIEATTRNVKAFEGLEIRTKAAADAMLASKAAAEKLAEQLATVEKNGGKASEELVTDLKSAERELKATTFEYDR